MKISSNYIYKPNFGFDRKLNEELINKLAEYPDKKWAKTISSLNKQCNDIETTIRTAEQDKTQTDSRFEEYIDIFASLKQTLASIVAGTFPQLNFPDREISHYSDEYIKTNSTETENWRLEVCESLIPLASQQTQRNLTQVTIDNKKTKTKDDTPIISTAKKTNISETSYLEQFIPTANTPKGFSDVIGMETLKRDLKEGVIEYILNPEQAQKDFEDYGKEIPKAVLLYGPPGCGKTYITQALSQEGNFPLYMLTIGKAGSHYMNLTSKNIKEAFDEAIKIANDSGTPCLLFLDEVDSIGFNRTENMEADDLKIVATLLQCLDKAKDSNVVVIGATNKYDILDPAVKRRYTNKYFVDIPDDEAIKGLLIKTLSPMKKAQTLLSSDEQLSQIARLLNGYTNDSICKITKHAALSAMRRNRANIELIDFESVLKETNEEKPDRRAYLSESRKKTSRIGF